MPSWQSHFIPASQSPLPGAPAGANISNTGPPADRRRPVGSAREEEAVAKPGACERTDSAEAKSASKNVFPACQGLFFSSTL